VIVSCPACATRFSLDATLLGPNGRNVRCAKCGHRWKQEPPPAAPAELPPIDLDQPGAAAAAAPAESTAEPPPGIAPGLAALLGGQAAAQAAPRPTPGVVVPPKLQPAKPARKTGLWPWVLVAGILCGLAAAAYLFQGPIMRMVPGAEEVYTLIGLGERDPAKELQIGNLKSEQRSGLVSVRGDIFNPTEYPLKVPPLMLTAKDGTGNVIGDGFRFRTRESEIAPGETITFRILYQDPPQGMKKFAVTFGRLNPKEP
jgi:predicted Zn finger-like uncharacterized protein